MINIAPTHIRKYCFCDYSDKIFKEIFDKYDDTNTAIYKIKCSCGNTLFKVYVDPNPTVKIICTKCLKEIIVYDLIFYPAATKCPDKNDVFESVIYGSQTEFEVYAMYEYRDDYEDENDISWCHVYLNFQNDLIEIIDDETS